MQGSQRLGAVSLLLAPVRWRLYQYIRDSGDAVGRDEAARAAEISRSLAAFHLDRMAEAGLLTVEYRRLTQRRGRGAGRPAKLYRAASQRVAVSLSTTRYPLAGRILASAVVEKSGEEDAVAAVRRVAGRVATELGDELRDELRERSSGNGDTSANGDTSTNGDAAGDGETDGNGADDRPLGIAERAVRELGYDPEPSRGQLVLRNCPFAELAASHRDLICQMNHALLTGLLPAVGAGALSAVGPKPSKRPGFCCVTIAPGEG
jgi:predicted ArsR family transcriptional regulator